MKIREDNHQNVLSKEEKQLLQIFAGNKILEQLRGKFTQEQLDLFLELLAETPRRTKKDLDAFISQLRVILCKLAAFKRDGKLELFEHICKALTDPTYRFPGEIVPLDQTVPVTLLVCKPEIMFKVLSFLKRDDIQHGRELTRAVAKVSRNEDLQKIDKEILEIIKLLPSCRQYCHPSREQYMAYLPTYMGLGTAFDADVVKPFQEKINNALQDAQSFTKLPNGFAILAPATYELDDLKIFYNPDTDEFKVFYQKEDDEQEEKLSYYEEDFEEYTIPYPQQLFEKHGKFAFLIASPIKQVLKCFTRQEQKQIAVWSFSIPKIALEMETDFLPMIGFYPPQDHDFWKRKKPCYTSKNNNRFAGAILILNENDLVEYAQYLPRNEYYILAIKQQI